MNDVMVPLRRDLRWIEKSPLNERKPLASYIFGFQLMFLQLYAVFSPYVGLSKGLRNRIGLVIQCLFF
jgi:hypothetical protein